MPPRSAPRLVAKPGHRSTARPAARAIVQPDWARQSQVLALSGWIHQRHRRMFPATSLLNLWESRDLPRSRRAESIPSWTTHRGAPSRDRVRPATRHRDRLGHPDWYGRHTPGHDQVSFRAGPLGGLDRGAVLATATGNNARTWGVPGGCIKVGTVADVVIMDAAWARPPGPHPRRLRSVTPPASARFATHHRSDLSQPASPAPRIDRRHSRPLTLCKYI
jgi:hypothetical protein